MLYPVENKVREVKNLSGIWNFKMDYDNVGIQEQWQKMPLKDTIPMAVPSSYNDLLSPCYKIYFLSVCETPQAA